MTKHFLIILLPLLFVTQGHALPNPLDLDQAPIVNGEIVIEANDAGETVTMGEEEYAAFTGQDFLNHLVSFFNFKKTFDEVASYITPTLESEYDVFMIINVDYETRFNGADEIPAQHMKVIRRTQEGQLLFNRDEQGQVVSIRSDVLGNNGEGAFAHHSDLMPISSGAGHFSADPQPYVDTPTGIYRVNFNRSDRRRYSTGMWHSLYFDLIYPSGRESGLAVHGTSPGQYGNLGTQRSHGCVRITQPQANSMYEELINSGRYWSKDLPNLDNRSRLKSEVIRNGEVQTKAGVRALIVLFYGYGDKETAVEI